MKRVTTVLVALGVLSVVPVLRGHEPEPPPDGSAGKAPPVMSAKVREVMRRKKELAHDLLDAIVMQNFARVNEDAGALGRLSRAAEWQVLQTPRYLQYSLEFQEAAEKMGKNARDKNADGVTLAFTEMTLNCVRCHEYIRQVRSTRLFPRPGSGVGTLATRSAAGAPASAASAR